MNIIPAIDIMSGYCVRLYQGSFDNVTRYHTDPVVIAQFFYKQGAKFLHVVDLDGAKTGKPVHLDIVMQILQKTKLKIQMGGGIRDHQQLKTILDAGVSRVILGSVAVSQPDLVHQWLKEFGVEKIVLGFDVRIDEGNIPLCATHGWQMNSLRSLWELLDEYDEDGLHILCTDIERDGTLTGPNIEFYRECHRRYPSLHFQASGGICQISDLTELSGIPVSDVIIGKALYENHFNLIEALVEVREC
jgi:phosphoribosylformimino-5-aminoimidazole carboxamide ribotide isomerase